MGAPRFRNLPAVEGSPPHSSWGLWGKNDDVGAVHFLTAERMVAAAQLIRKGAAFSLNLELDLPDPPILGRTRLKHTIFDGPSGTDDKYDDFYPQASSHWDALSHVAHPKYGFYNDWKRRDIGIGPGSKLGIDAWARRGLAGRFVLLDLARYRESIDKPLDQTERLAFGVADLEAASRQQGVEVSDGSVLLLRFGWMEWYLRSNRQTRERLGEAKDLSDPTKDWENMFHTPGLEASEDVAAWLWDHEIPAVAADCPAVEAMPGSRVSEESSLHFRLVPLLGIALGELFYLEMLAQDCLEDGVFEGFFTATPLNKVGGCGSPSNALAVK